MIYVDSGLIAIGSVRYRLNINVNSASSPLANKSLNSVSQRLKLPLTGCQ
jgi:hypothetical protein